MIRLTVFKALSPRFAPSTACFLRCADSCTPRVLVGQKIGHDLPTTATTSQTGVCQRYFYADLRHDAADETCEVFCGSHSGVQLPQFDVTSEHLTTKMDLEATILTLRDICKREDKLGPSRSRIVRTQRNFFSKEVSWNPQMPSKPCPICHPSSSFRSQA